MNKKDALTFALSWAADVLAVERDAGNLANAYKPDEEITLREERQLEIALTEVVVMLRRRAERRGAQGG